MSDEKKPFAVVDEDSGIIRIAGIDVSYGVRWSDATDINAAVERERREAAVKALRQAADMIEPSEIKAGPGGAPGFVQGKEDGLTIAAKYLRARAEIIERGEQ